MNVRLAAGFAVLAMSLSGCADYMNHRDSVTLGAGNAMEGNIGLHTIDPFPEVANNTDIDRQSSDFYKKQQSANPCDFASQTASNGSSCGGRAAEMRPGGETPSSQ